MKLLYTLMFIIPYNILGCFGRRNVDQLICMLDEDVSKFVNKFILIQFLKLLIVFFPIFLLLDYNFHDFLILFLYDKWFHHICTYLALSKIPLIKGIYSLQFFTLKFSILINLFFHLNVVGL